MRMTRKKFKEITGHNALYSIMPLENISSVLEYGILSHDLAEKHAHISVALEDVQAKREQKVTNAGRTLHSYANLYFDSWNPMLSKLRQKNKEICILAINPMILELQEVVIADRNAASKLVSFITPEMMDTLDFRKIYMKYWNDEDPFVKDANKLVKCAEVLVPDCVPASYILGAVVADGEVEKRLKELGFDKQIIVDRNRFF